MHNALNNIFNNLTKISSDIHQHKTAFLEQNKMTEYNLCNNCRISFYQFRQQFLNQIKNSINDKEFDFSVLSEEMLEVEKLFETANSFESAQLTQNIKLNLKEIEERINIFASKVKDFTPEHTKRMREHILEFEYKTLY